MTKAKARERAKTKAVQKIKKREANAANPELQTRPGQFDPGSNSIKSPNLSGVGRSSGAARRGAARSK